MSRAFTPKVVTASRLIEGDVVWLAANGEWVGALKDARLFTEQEEAEAALGAAARQSLFIVGAYLADAKAGPDGPEPTHFREDFRTRGPSNYRHGKQETA